MDYTVHNVPVTVTDRFVGTAEVNGDDMTITVTVRSDPFAREPLRELINLLVVGLASGITIAPKLIPAEESVHATSPERPNPHSGN